ncbi:MAG: hypothetical protein ACR2F6_09065 [Mycobacteriales bacterium]
MRRWKRPAIGLAGSITAAAALAVGGTALVVHAVGSCPATTASFAPSTNAPGAATASAAVASYVSRTALPRSGWRPDSTTAGTYHSGEATVTVTEMRNNRWQVIGVKYPSCKYR